MPGKRPIWSFLTTRALSLPIHRLLLLYRAVDVCLWGKSYVIRGLTILWSHTTVCVSRVPHVRSPPHESFPYSLNKRGASNEHYIQKLWIWFSGLVQVKKMSMCTIPGEWRFGSWMKSGLSSDAGVGISFPTTAMDWDKPSEVQEAKRTCIAALMNIGIQLDVCNGICVLETITGMNTTTRCYNRTGTTMMHQ